MFGSTDKLWLSRISFFGTNYGRENGEKFTPSGQKVPTLHTASFKWWDTCSKNWKQKWWMYGCTRIFPIEKEIKLKPKTIGNRLYVRLLEVLNNTWENLQIARPKSAKRSSCSAHQTDLPFTICRFSQVVFITSNNLSHNNFFISNSFGF